MVPTPASPATEAKKTEPDENTYLVFKHGLDGADPGYDYGTHFLFQGHEGGAGGAGYITRINLDADAAHRVTLMATRRRRRPPAGDDRRLDLGPVGEAPAVHHREPRRADLRGDAGLPLGCGRRLRRARPRRLRGHP